MAKNKTLMIIGGLHHPFEDCGRILKEKIEATGRNTVTVTTDRNALLSENLEKYDAVVVYTQGGKLTRRQESGLLDFVKNGGGFVGIHSATASWQGNDRYIDMIGGVFASHGPVTEFDVNISESDCWITDRISDFRIVDEFYILDRFDPEKVEVLATARWRGKTHPMAWTKSYGAGRVFYLALGHDERAFEHEAFGKLAVRGLEWTLGKQPHGTVKSGCIGYGGAFDISRLHLESMARAGFDVVAVCDIDPLRREAAAGEWPGVQTYSSVGRMLKDSDVELVAVNTPHHLHAKLAVQCLKAGRHVVTEKPMCISVKQADAMIDAAGGTGRMLSVFHNRRWDGDYMAIKDTIAKGLLGDIFHIELCGGGYSHPGYWWRSDKRISGGAFYDWGAHFVDWVLNIVPADIAEISGHFVEDAVWHDVTNEDHCHAVVRFTNGCCASFELSSLAGIPKKKWRILGTLGALEDLGEGQLRVVTYKHGRSMDSRIPYMKSDWHAYYRNIADHLTLDEPLAVTPESGRRVISVLDTAGKSAHAQKALKPAPRYQ